MKPKILAVAFAVALALAPMRAHSGALAPVVVAAPGATGGAAFGLVGCVAGIMLAAIVAGREFNRELTAEEALTCGLLFWINRANAPR